MIYLVIFLMSRKNSQQTNNQLIQPLNFLKYFYILPIHMI